MRCLVFKWVALRLVLDGEAPVRGSTDFTTLNTVLRFNIESLSSLNIIFSSIYFMWQNDNPQPTAVNFFKI